MKTSSHRVDLLTALILTAGAFAVYLRTMSPGVGTEDPGELAVVLHSLGIAHPTGYPLFTMLGSVFLQILPGEANIWRMNLFGAILTAVSVFFFHGVFRFLFSDRGRALLGFGRGDPGTGEAPFSRHGGGSADQAAAAAAQVKPEACLASGHPLPLPTRV
jgi:hypothetical protein